MVCNGRRMDLMTLLAVAKEELVRACRALYSIVRDLLYFDENGSALA